MPLNHFIHVLNSYLPLSQGYQDFLREHVKTIYVKAKQEFLPFNHHKLVFFFVHKGMIYSWRVDNEGNIIPKQFTYENQLTGTTINPLYPDLIPDGMSSVEDSILVTGDVAISSKAIERFEEARELINILVSDGIARQQKLNNALLLHNAEDRYKSLQEIAPLLFKRVPERLLAPYLNMSRVHLNRIKNGYFK